MLRAKMALATATCAVTFFVLSCGTAAAGLLAYWDMNDTSGTTVADSSGNGLNATFVGTAGATAGKFGNAASFNGSSYIDCGTNSKLDLGAGNFTFSLWFQGAPDSFRWLMSYNGRGTKDSEGNFDPALVLTTYHTDQDTANSYFRPSYGSWFNDPYSYVGSTTLNSSTEWYHLALTRDGTTLSGYVNGQSVFSSSQTAYNFVLNNSLLLGKLYDGPNFTGAMDDVAIWNQALTGSQIQSLYAGTATPANVVPEPSMITIMIAGAFSLLAYAWRKRKCV